MTSASFLAASTDKAENQKATDTTQDEGSGNGNNRNNNVHK